MKLSSAEAVVIGGGLIGTATTYYLAKMGVDVELVERSGIASGTSSACDNVLSLQTKAPGPKLALAAESVRIYHGLSDELEYDLEFRNEGSMIAALNEAELEYISALVDRLRAAGVNVELLDPRAARDAQPALTTSSLSVSYCPLDCNVNPMRVCLAFARAAARLGARLRLGAAVTSIEVQNGRIASVTTSEGRITTPTVINAAGVWAPAIAQMVGLELAIVPRRGQITVTEALPPLVRGHVFGARYLMSKLGKHDEAEASTGGAITSGIALGQQASGNFLIGGTREFVGFDTSVTVEGLSDLAAQAIELVPTLREVKIIRAFAGLRPFTPDGLPIIRRFSEPEGFITAAGHEGDGVCLAPVTGRIVADILAGRIDDYSQFKPAVEAGP